MQADNDVETIRQIVAEVLEVAPERVQSGIHFMHDLDADSLRVIEILARLEGELKVVIDQADLASMVSLDSVLEVVRAARNGA